MTDDPTFIAHAQVTPSGQPWVEMQVTGEAANQLARAVTHRTAGYRPVVHSELVNLVAGVITSTSLTLTPEQADQLVCDLTEAATLAEDTAREGDYWAEVTP